MTLMKRTGSVMLDQSAKEMTSRNFQAKGYNQTIAIGGNDIQIVLPAQAGTLLGIAFSANMAADFSLTVNNELVHEKIAMAFAVPMPNGALGLQPYFPINRKVYGKDDIRLTINSSAATPIEILIYYK